MLDSMIRRFYMHFISLRWFGVRKCISIREMLLVNLNLYDFIR